MRQRRPVNEQTAWIPGAMPFFLFGFIFYIVSPAVVFHFLAGDSALLDNATRYLDSGYFDSSYALDGLTILISFLVGYRLGKTFTKSRPSLADNGSFKTSVPKIVAMSFAALIMYFAAMASMSGTGFFTGYSTYNILILGPFSTCIFLSAWFVNYFSARQIRLLFFSFFMVCSVLLLGWGSRMFFVLGFMALILGLVSNNRWLLKNVWFYAFGVIACLAMIAVGIAREGGREFSSANLVAMFFAEPFFTSVSGNLYLEGTGGRPVYGVPNDLLAAVIHFVPSAIFPGKVELISAITFDEKVQSPFGAKSLLVSLYSNFGIFYPIFIASIGLYYGFLCKKARHSRFYRATYFSALPVLALLFYREGLTTVIKVLFFNGLLVPLFVALSLVWLFPRPIADAGGKSSHAAPQRRLEMGNRGSLEAKSE